VEDRDLHCAAFDCSAEKERRDTAAEETRSRQAAGSLAAAALLPEADPQAGAEVETTVTGLEQQDQAFRDQVQ